MKVLIAEDDAFFRKILEHLLAPEFEIRSAEDGISAWSMLQQNDAPMLAVLDWVMPGMTGPQICREARANPRTAGCYMILLTARNSTADIVDGLRSGADDYVTKPFEREELQARVRVGRRIIQLQADLAAQRAALEDALAREKSLQGGMILLRADRNAETLVLPAAGGCGPPSPVEATHGHPGGSLVRSGRERWPARFPQRETKG
jgi:DNA-binding response OmpR family regulator